MNWSIFFIIFILTVIAAIMEYFRSKKNRKAVIILIIGFAISALSGNLFTTDKEGSSSGVVDEEYQQYYEEKREEIFNAERNREYDLMIDCLKQLANETESVYGEESLELGALYAEIGQAYNFLSDTVNAKKYVDFSKAIVLNYVPDKDNYINIARIYKACGDADSDFTESEYFYNKALSIMSEFNDMSSQLTASICANFSNAYTVNNDHVNALKYAEQAQNLYENKLGTTSREAGIMYCALGNIYSMRNHIKALEYYQEAEKIFKNNSPDDDSFLAICYSGLANLYSNIDQKECYTYARAAWNLNKSIFGEFHERTINSEIDMAVYYRTNNEISQAKLLLEEALLKSEEEYGSNSTTAKIYIELGNIEGSLEKCLFYYDKAESILKNLYGEKHEDVAYVYSNKSVSYYLNNDLVDAKEYYKKAVDIYKDKSGSFSPDLAYMYGYMGEIYYDENNFTDAIKKYEDAKEIYDTLYGSSNINSAYCTYKIARVYSYVGEKDLADEMFEQAIKLYEMIYGEYSFQNTDLYYEYAKHIYRFGGDINMAIEYARKAMDFSTANSTAQVQYSFVLGNLYIEANYREKGMEYLKECVRIAEYNKFMDPSYIQALCALAQQYSILEDERVNTMVYISKAIDAAIQAGGSEDLWAAYYHTSVALGNLGEYSQALEYLDIAEQAGLKVYAEDSKYIKLIEDYRAKIMEWM